MLLYKLLHFNNLEFINKIYTFLIQIQRFYTIEYKKNPICVYIKKKANFTYNF